MFNVGARHIDRLFIAVAESKGTILAGRNTATHTDTQTQLGYAKTGFLAGTRSTGRKTAPGPDRMGKARLSER
jgi:hypothetical protein